MENCDQELAKLIVAQKKNYLVQPDFTQKLDQKYLRNRKSGKWSVSCGSETLTIMNFL